MGYHVTKDLKAEIKVGGSLFLKDLMGLILFPAAMYFLTSAMTEKQSGKTDLADSAFDVNRR